ncbi:MAG: response regulator transcription factor [Fibrobacteria bacterium]|nr:response regulator transcription factor [Fibrobacteria bacterium]
MAKILVVDDEQDIADLIKLVLELEQHEVTVVTDAEEAVPQACALQPDLVLLDLVMPHMDGYDVLRELRAENSLKKVPVAFLTSKNKSVDFMVGLHMMKVDDYITKPFGKKDLLDRVKKLLNKKTKG